MSSSLPPAAREKPSFIVWSWLLFFAALALVPDEKPLRLKLVALEAAVVSAGLAAAWAASRGERSWARTPADVFVALWASVATLFWLSSPEPAACAPEFARALSCAVVFFAASQGAARVERPGRILWLWAVSGAVAGLWAWYGWRFAGQLRPHGGFGNPIFLGQFLAASAAATFGLAALARGWPARGALNLMLACQLLGLWLTQSRGAWVGLAGALGLWLVFRSPKQLKVPFMLAMAATAVFLFHHFKGRSLTHWHIWRGAANLWLDHPWFGAGLGRFHLEFPEYAPLELKALWPKTRFTVNYAHNEYLQLLAETGVAGLLAFLAAPLAVARKFYAPSEQERAALADVPALAAAAFLCGAFVSPDLRFGVSSLACFAALGMAAGLRLAEWSSWRAVPAWTRSPALACAVGVIVLWGRLSAEPLIAERSLQAEPEFSSPQTLPPASVPAGDPEQQGYWHAQHSQWPEAIDRFKQAAAQHPGRPGPLNNIGNVYYSMGDHAAAEDYWNRSLVVMPTQADAHLNLAKLLYERGDLKAAARHAQRALDADPHNPKARALLKRLTGG